MYWQLVTENDVECYPETVEIEVSGGALAVKENGVLVEAYAPGAWRHCIKLTGECPD
jgi:hypothetical protein